MLRAAALLILVGACTDGSGFAGAYETVTASRGTCGNEEVDEPVVPQDQYFRLDDVDVTGGLLVAYYACADLARCEDLYDLSRSFGRAKDDDSHWAGYVSSAIPTMGCTLTYRVRQLSTTTGGVRISTQVYRMSDGTLMGADCDQAVAAERGTTMPCLETSTLVAEDR